MPQRLVTLFSCVLTVPGATGSCIRPSLEGSEAYAERRDAQLPYVPLAALPE